MMSKKQWFVVLCIFITYLCLGAALFYLIESKEENIRIEEEVHHRHISADFIDQIYNKSHKIPRKKDFVKALEDYCGKPFEKNAEEPQHVWDYYHSLFFVITVVSTIGYGNLAPTTTFTRLFMIFYGLIGIPLCGIVMVTLGTFFGRSFTKLYQRWKTSKMQYDTTRLGLISQIILYLVPGFTFFCFLPSAFMVIFEDWPFDVAVYYCFVTLTTIGFGDYVAGVENTNGFKLAPFWAYKIFLLVWVIGGLGYVVMILGFITKVLQSRKIHMIEQMIKNNMKKTPVRIRQELRSLLQEFLFMKVKHAYKGEFDYIPSRLERSQSCPDLSIYRSDNSPTIKRKRAYSECPHQLILQPDNDLDHISRDSASENYIQRSDLLMKVVDALSILEDQDDLGENRGYDGLSESEILANEFGSKWSLRSHNLTPQPKPQRRRAISDVRVPTMRRAEAHQDIAWFGQDPSDNYQSFLARQRTFSESAAEIEKSSQNLITRIKNRFISSKDDKDVDVEQNRRRVSMFTPAEDRYLRQTNRGRASVMSVQQQEAVLEQTSIADFIRALSSITGPETMLPPAGGPKRKLGTAGLTPPKTQSPPRTRRLAIRPNVATRRTSLMPDSNIIQNERRRLSLRPVSENLLAPPPPYSPHPDEVNRPTRRFSRLLNVPNVSISPVQRQVFKRENKDDS